MDTASHIRTIFNEIQTCSGHKYNENIKTITRILESSDSFEEFRKVLAIVLLSPKQEIPKGIYSFLKRIIYEYKINNSCMDFIQQLYNFLFSIISCRDKKVRKNAISLLQLLEIRDGDLARLSEKLFDKDKGVRRECVKLLKRYKNALLSPKTTIQGLFKDLIRHDPSHDVRKEALRSIDVDLTTYSCVISKCEDPSESVRKVFYYEKLALIDLKKAPRDKRVLILKKSFVERDFDAKEIFRKKCLIDYNTSEISQLVLDFYEPEALSYLSELLKYYFSSCTLHFDLEYLESISLPSSYLLLEHLKFIEEEFGREHLKMISLDLFLEHLYRVCCESISDHDKIPVAKNLFQILRFYEIFESSVQHTIKRMAYKMLGKSFVEEIVEEIITIPCISSDYMFLGTLIKKNIESESVLYLCKSIMKNIRPFSDLHDAIVVEVLSRYENAASSRRLIFDTLFFYYLERPSEEHLQILIENIAETFPLVVDLYLGDPMNDAIKKHIVEHLARNGPINEETLIPVTKIMLIKGSDLFLEEVVEIYYQTKNDEIRQYLTVFFYEYFGKFTDILISKFCKILSHIKSGHRLWVDQSVYWLLNAKNSNVAEFVYRVCVFIYKTGEHAKILLTAFDSFVLDGSDPVLIKKIIYCCTLLLKKGVDVSSLIGKAMVVDNGEPIEKVDLDHVKNDIEIYDY